MARHEFSAKLPGCRVAIGWDNPLTTFFATVIREAEPDEDDQVLLWLGDTPSAITTPEQLIGPLARYFDVTPEVIATLKADRVAALDRGPTPHQRAVNRMFDQVRRLGARDGKPR